MHFYEIFLSALLKMVEKFFYFALDSLSAQFGLKGS